MLLISSYTDQEGDQLQQTNFGFLQHTPFENQYTFKPVVLTSQATQIIFRILSVEQELGGVNETTCRRKNGEIYFVIFIPGNRLQSNGARYGE